jgi:hypothetical protein
MSDRKHQNENSAYKRNLIESPIYYQGRAKALEAKRGVDVADDQSKLALTGAIQNFLTGEIASADSSTLRASTRA